MAEPKKTETEELDSTTTKKVSSSTVELVRSGKASAYTSMPEVEPIPTEPNRPKRNPILPVVFILLALAGAYQVQRKFSSPAESAPVSIVKEEKILPLSSVEYDSVATQKAVFELKSGRIPESLKDASPIVQAQVKNGNMRLFTLKVIDTEAEDGDVVRISSNGEALAMVNLRNQGATITLPLTSEKNQSIEVTAVKDGQGGITFGAASSLGDVRTRNMKVGDVEVWHVQMARNNYAK